MFLPSSQEAQLDGCGLDALDVLGVGRGPPGLRRREQKANRPRGSRSHTELGGALAGEAEASESRRLVSSISLTRTPMPGCPEPALSEAQADVCAPSASAHEPQGSCPPARLSSHLGGPEPRESDAGLERGRSSTINRSKYSTAKGSDQTEVRGYRTHWTEREDRAPLGTRSPVQTALRYHKRPPEPGTQQEVNTYLDVWREKHSCIRARPKSPRHLSMEIAA
ncbi:unnamed protein product [Rangifer tarandus platyrhynchus]|uniref:Uncharacterized protein n=1 Tax=Rangifer tarandus platyrhynchus TaxID=3082113 RepID=A0ABN8YLY2_RANTA|nr:unnamed protein product [Rangifer tarandus platyrhynchus]